MLARKGVPWPYLITPKTDDEANCGHATLLTEGDLIILLGALKGSRKWRDDHLIAKLEALS